MKITAQDFLDAYNKNGVKPITGRFNVAVKDGVFTLSERGLKTNQCCPITAYMLGREAVVSEAQEEGLVCAADCLLACFEELVGVGTFCWGAFDRHATFPENDAERASLAVQTAHLLREVFGDFSRKAGV